MNTITYEVIRQEKEIDTISGVYNVSMNDKFLIIEYFDGEFHHTRNIPLPILVNFVLYKK